MDTIADLIDAAKARTGANYSDIGERLERSKQLITNWRSGAKVPTDGDVMALARMAAENADKWLAIAQAAQTEGEARSRWEQIAKRLATTAAAVAGIVLTTYLFGAEKGTVLAAFSTTAIPAQLIHYAKCRT